MERVMPIRKLRIRPTPPPQLTILDAINDPALFAPWFKDREAELRAGLEEAAFA